MEQRTHDKQVLDRNLIEYTFCEIFTVGSNSISKRQELKKALRDSGKSILGRKLKQVVGRFDENRKNEIHRYLKGRQVRESVFASETLLLTLPEFEETLQNYCKSGYRNELKTIEIAEAIREPGLPRDKDPLLADIAKDVSIKISQVRLKGKDGRLFSLAEGQELYLRFRKNPTNKKEYFYWLVIETKGELALEKTLGIVISAPEGMKTEKLLDDPAMSSILSDIEMWKPCVSRATSGALAIVDVFMVKASSSVHTRFYVEEGRLFTIYEKKALAVERVAPIVEEE